MFDIIDMLRGIKITLNYRPKKSEKCSILHVGFEKNFELIIDKQNKIGIIFDIIGILEGRAREGRGGIFGTFWDQNHD